MAEVRLLPFDDRVVLEFFEKVSYLGTAYLDIFRKCATGICFVRSERYPVTLPGAFIESPHGLFLNCYPWYSMWSELWFPEGPVPQAAVEEAWREILETIEIRFRAAVIVENPWRRWSDEPASEPDRQFYFVPNTANAAATYGRSTRQKLAQVERREIEIRTVRSLREYGFKEAFLAYYGGRGYKLKPDFFWDVVESRLGSSFQATVALRQGVLLAGTLSAHLGTGTMAEGSFLVKRDKECSVGMAAIIDHAIRHAANSVYILGSNALSMEGVSFFKKDFGCEEVPIRYRTLGEALPRAILSELMAKDSYFYFYPVHKCV